MSEPTAVPADDRAHETGRGFGRVLVFVYGVLAFAATGRASFELLAKFSDAPVPYGLSVLAAVVYVVATCGLATNRRRVALVAVCFELLGVLAVGFSSLLWTSKFPEATSPCTQTGSNSVSHRCWASPSAPPIVARQRSTVAPRSRGIRLRTNFPLVTRAMSSRSSISVAR